MTNLTGLNGPWNLSALINPGNTTSNNVVGIIPHIVIQNLPWITGFWTLMWYVALYIWWANEPGTDKYVLITFLGMILAWLFAMFTFYIVPGSFSLADVAIPTMASALFIFTLIMVQLFG